jgi:hypothetical protein
LETPYVSEQSTPSSAELPGCWQVPQFDEFVDRKPCLIHAAPICSIRPS